jgi:hypothetical protein
MRVPCVFKPAAKAHSVSFLFSRNSGTYVVLFLPTNSFARLVDILMLLFGDDVRQMYRWRRQLEVWTRPAPPPDTPHIPHKTGITSIVHVSKQNSHYSFLKRSLVGYVHDLGNWT